MTRDTLLRSLAAAAALFCGAYFVFGMAAFFATEQKGTAIGHYEPITFAMLWQEVGKVSFKTVFEWFSVVEGCGSFLISTLSLWFLATLFVSFLLAIHPRLFLRSRWALLCATLMIGLGGALFGLLGLRSIKYTLLNAFFLRGLDGEWIMELGPVFDAAGILYVVACLLLARSWFFRIRLDGSAAA